MKSFRNRLNKICLPQDQKLHQLTQVAIENDFKGLLYLIGIFAGNQVSAEQIMGKKLSRKSLFYALQLGFEQWLTFFPGDRVNERQAIVNLQSQFRFNLLEYRDNTGIVRNEDKMGIVGRPHRSSDGICDGRAFLIRFSLHGIQD